MGREPRNDSPAARHAHAPVNLSRAAVRLTGGGQDDVELHAGDHAAIPPLRHGLDALEDAVVLISVAQGPGAAGTSRPGGE